MMSTKLRSLLCEQNLGLEGELRIVANLILFAEVHLVGLLAIEQS